MVARLEQSRTLIYHRGHGGSQRKACDGLCESLCSLWLKNRIEITRSIPGLYSPGNGCADPIGAKKIPPCPIKDNMSVETGRFCRVDRINYLRDKS